MSKMVEQDSPFNRIAIAPPREQAQSKYPWMHSWWFRLLALLFLATTFAPFLIWPLRLPRTILITIEGLAAVIVLMAFAYMLKEDRIPKGILVILGISLIWGIVAAFEGQSLAAYLWGWWKLFNYPLVGIFTYLVVGKPKDFAEWFLRFCMVFLGFQVVVQLIMYALGFPPGDDLAGTYGFRGVMQHSMIVFFVVCMGLGHWMATGRLKYLLFGLTVGLIGTMLSGTKFYLFGVAALLVVTFIINMVRGGKLRQLFILLFVAVLVGAVFLPIFNNYMARSGGSTLLDFLDPEVLTEYLLYTNTTGNSYYIGRGYAPIYSWQLIRRDPTTILFGYGLGARTSSNVLGISGVQLAGDLYGGATGSALATWMQEYGMVGLAVFVIIIVWITMKLFRFLSSRPDPYQASMAYGLILFTSFWPVWLWYHNVWAADGMLFLYWVAVGYILRQALPRSRKPSRKSASSSRQLVKP